MSNILIFYLAILKIDGCNLPFLKIDGCICTCCICSNGITNLVSGPYSFSNSVSLHYITNFIYDRYIAICSPLLHHDLVHTYSVMRRVTIYTVPVILVSLILNIPKFLETKIVTKMTEIRNNSTSDYHNFTTYTIDVTDLR